MWQDLPTVGGCGSSRSSSRSGRSESVCRQDLDTRDVCIAACGDGLLDAGDEECDDGNLKNEDGCDQVLYLPITAFVTGSASREVRNRGWKVV